MGTHDAGPLTTAEARQPQEFLDADIGARKPSGLPMSIIVWVAIIWSLFQIWMASPLPYIAAQWIPGMSVLNSTQARSIHLAFALFLAFLLYPAFKRSPQDRIPLHDWVIAAVAAFAAAYLFLFYDALTMRAGSPSALDVTVGCIGLLVLLEATRRTLGLPLTVLATIFLLYVFFGQYAPGVLAWAGASFSRATSHMWLTTEGVFGVALGVSERFVFLFVLFGAMLDKAGAGNYFIKIAFALLGHFKGGPAKASVLSSGLTGLISGSSIANVVTTGTFTIPLMKRLGYPNYKAGAVESAASVNGQIMPPVMGAAAFLMVEFVGIPYLQVIKHAFLPAIATYIALFYIVHLEAVKLDLPVLPDPNPHRSLKIKLLRSMIILCSILIIAGASYYAIELIRILFGDFSFWAVALAACIAYVLLVAYAARFPPLEQDDPDQPVVATPDVGPTLKVGLYYIIPVFILVWSLMIDRLSAGLSVFYAIAFLVLLLITQRPLLAFFRHHAPLSDSFRAGTRDLREALFSGARNMIGVAIACAAAGVIVGMVTLSGVGQVLTQFVDLISGGSLFGVLLFVAFICLILGMGLPTTANYIVVSSLLAPVVVELGAQHGLAVPLIAVHLFVFYFGLMADVTPPVGLAAYAAAAIAKSDPIRTGAQAFGYEIRTGLLPFMFIFNTKLLLIGIEGPLDLLFTLFGALAGMLLFCAATQRWLVTRTRLWESAVILLIAFTLIRPGFWLNIVQPPYSTIAFSDAGQTISKLDPGTRIRLQMTGMSIEGTEESKTVDIPLQGEKGTPIHERLGGTGLAVEQDADQWMVQQVKFGSPAARAGIGPGYEITSMQIKNAQSSAYWFYIPAALLFMLVVWGQRRRVRLVVKDV